MGPLGGADLDCSSLSQAPAFAASPWNHGYRDIVLHDVLIVIVPIHEGMARLS